MKNQFVSKLFSLLLLAISLTAQPMFAGSQDKSCGKPSSCCQNIKEKKYCKKTGCEKRFCISQDDFYDEQHLPKSFRIKKSGKYTLCENVTYKPKKEKTAAIVIDADNVTLDLCGFTLSQGNNVLRTIGIEVRTGHENITILGSNGTVTEFSQLGIYVQGGNNFVQLGQEDSRLFVTGCGGKAPMAWGSVGNGYLEGGVAIGETNFWAFNMGTYHGPISQANVENVIVEENSPVGIYLGNGNDFALKNSSFSNNFDTRLNGIRTIFDRNPGIQVSAFGIIHSSSKRFNGDTGINGWTIDSCLVNGNFADGTKVNAEITFVDGLQFEEASNVVVKNSQFNNNKSFGATLRSQARGNSFGGGFNVQFIECEACGNTAGRLAEGFHQSGFLTSANPADGFGEIIRTKTIVYERCISSNNICDYRLQGPGAPPRGFAVGFTFAYTAGGSLIDCVAENNKVFTDLENPNPDFIGDAEGVFIAGGDPDVPDVDCDSIVISGCRFSGNTCDATVGVPFAVFSEAVQLFDSFNHNISFDSCVFTKNSVFEGEPGNRIDAAFIMLGFDPSQPAQLVSIFNSLISNHRTAGVWAFGYDKTNVQNCEISENGVGVLIDTCACNSILDNTFLHNGLAVEDVATSTANPSTSLVAGNQAFDNGTGSTSTCYDVWYAFGPAPTTSSDLTVGFPPLATVTGENSEVLGSCSLAVRAERLPMPAVDKETIMANLAKHKEAKIEALFNK